MIKKVGNIEFNVEHIKDLSLEEFKDKYRGKLDKVDIEDAYVALVGKPKKVVKAKKKYTD